jgi:hypothetical protein
MGGFSARLAELEAAVARLTARAGIPRDELVDLRAVAESLGCSVQSHRGIAEGRLCLQGGRAVVQLHPDAAAARRRFTFAHELAHAFLLHPERDLNGAICRQWSSPEAFCNDFAACLLLPRPWLDAQLSGVPEDLGSLRRVARLSGASLSACSLRLLRAGRWAHAALSWRPIGREWRLRAGALSPCTGSQLRLGAGGTHLESSDENQWIAMIVMLPGGRRVLRAQVHVQRSSALTFVPVRSTVDGRFDLAWEPLDATDAVLPRPPSRTRLNPGAGGEATPRAAHA